MKRAAQLLWLSALALGCGSHANDEIPEALLNAIATSQADPTPWPGPYGTREQEIAANLCVPGWQDPAAANYDAASFQTLCFSDFYDPAGASVRLVLITTSAIWCTSCRAEYGGTGSRPSLAEELSARQDRGLRVFGILLQDVARNPASAEDGEAWASDFRVSFPFGIDPDSKMGAYTNAAVQPFGMVVDARDLRILKQIVGDQPKVLWPSIDALLDERNTP